jgi:hypothetical protein
MSMLTSDEAASRSALQSCVAALRPVAEYELDPAIDRRMLALGERKEFLAPEEHAELMALVALAQKRTHEKLQAELALRRLLEAFPELNDQP